VQKPALFEKAYVRMVAILAVVATGLLVPAQHALADPTYPPPPVINMSNIPAQYEPAVQAFETNAVNEVLTDHDLPASDFDAVLAWGRDDVRAQEWSDLDAIISEPASQRSANDQPVYDWFQGVEQQQQITAAQDAINEYLKWSGLSSISDTSAPLNYGPNGTGFCDYQPPGGSSGPFAGSYSGNQNQVCYQPCTDFVTDCAPAYPTLAQFEQWGDYDATQQESSDPNYYTTMVGTAVSMGIGLTAALGSAALPFGTAIRDRRRGGDSGRDRVRRGHRHLRDRHHRPREHPGLPRRGPPGCTPGGHCEERRARLPARTTRRPGRPRSARSPRPGRERPASRSSAAR
jgi:hypothetical protein